MWIVLFNALDDYGNREINENERSGMPSGNLRNRIYIEDAMRRIGEEAVNGALRIAALVCIYIVTMKSPAQP